MGICFGGAIRFTKTGQRTKKKAGKTKMAVLIRKKLFLVFPAFSLLFLAFGDLSDEV